MGASIGQAGGGKRRGRFARGGRFARTPVSEINVTPLVDVMLVLLVVFMVAAPMMTAGINVQLPKTAAKPLPSESKPPLTVSVDKDGKVYVGKIETAPETLATALQQAGGNAADPEAKVFLKADRGVDYGKVMQVIGRLNSAGYRKISLLTEHENDT